MNIPQQQTETGIAWERSRMQRIGFLYAKQQQAPGKDDPLDLETLGELLFYIRHEGYGRVLPDEPDTAD
jgi:hypothetical protein